MTMRERIYGGKLFSDGCEGLPEDRTNCKKRLMTFNQSSPEDMEGRMKALEELLCTKPQAWIEPPFNCCYGYNIHFHGGSYLNAGCIFIDDGEIHIGKGVMFGPSVTIATVGHPIHPKMRGYMYTDPVNIEDNCWIGAGATICPGVTIGENTVIAAGSVVNHDIPANCVAGGNPCKVIREIGEQDMKYYYKDRPFDEADLEECRRLDPPPAHFGEEPPK